MRIDTQNTVDTLKTEFDILIQAFNFIIKIN